MSRLYDRMLVHGVTFSPDPNEHISGEHIEDILLGTDRSETVVIKADNVADYWATHHAGVFVEASELPSIAPPWGAFFVEFPLNVHKLPSTEFLDFLIGDESVVSARSRLPRRIGCLCSGARIQDDADIRLGIRKKMHDWTGDWSRVKFTLNAFLFFEYTKGKIAGPTYQFILLLDKRGQIISDGSGKPRYLIDPLLADDDATADELEVLGTLGGWVFSPVRITLAFTHCKNVVLLDNSPPVKIDRKHRKRYSKPLCTYKTLEIEPFGRRASNGTNNGGGAKRSFHITRGHFRTYLPGKGPFGRDIPEAQTWWIESHVRGSKARGEVVKDYLVKAPR